MEPGHEGREEVRDGQSVGRMLRGRNGARP